MTDDGRPTTDKSGRASSSGKSSMPFKEPVYLYGSATAAIPLLTIRHDQTLDAWTAAVATAVRSGRIRRTYLSYPNLEKITGEDILLKLRATLGTKNVRCSVVSERPGQILISVVSLQLTTG